MASRTPVTREEWTAAYHSSSSEEWAVYRATHTIVKEPETSAEADRLAEIQAAKDKVASDKARAEAERQKREAEEAAKPPVYYDEKRDSQRIENDIALARIKPAPDVIAPVEVEEKITIPESRPEPVKPPTEKHWLDTFIFSLKSEFGKLIEMIQ